MSYSSSSSGISIRFEEVGSTSLERINSILGDVPKNVYRATYSALKRAGSTAKTEAGRYAASEYTITKGTFMHNVDMKTHIYGHTDWVASIGIGFFGTVLPLLTFSANYGSDGQLRTQVKRNGGYSTLQHVFVARIGGKAAVFERKGKSRLPIEQKYGPSTGHMMQNETIIQQMDKTITETFEKRAEHEILRVLNGWGT